MYSGHTTIYNSAFTILFLSDVGDLMLVLQFTSTVYQLNNKQIKFPTLLIFKVTKAV